MALESLIIGVHLFTVHAGPLVDGIARSLATPGVYAVMPSGLTLGAYRNSLSHTPTYQHNRFSAYVGWTWSTGINLGPMRNLSITAGGVTGYHNRPVSPLLGLSATIGTGEYAPRIMWVPSQTQPVSIAVERHF